VRKIKKLSLTSIKPLSSEMVERLGADPAWISNVLWRRCAGTRRSKVLVSTMIYKNRRGFF
jgi:hypothetical protein